LPPGPDALWRATAFAVSRRDGLDRALADRDPRTWLGYARNAARHDPGDDEQVEQWLEQARRDAALAADADTLADAWRRLADDPRAFLDPTPPTAPRLRRTTGPGTRCAARPDLRSAGPWTS
jgi:hypothetical protein